MERNKEKVQVFRGDYIGVNPEDESDTIDLRGGDMRKMRILPPLLYCNYILKGVITVE